MRAFHPRLPDTRKSANPTRAQPAQHLRPLAPLFCLVHQGAEYSAQKRAEQVPAKLQLQLASSSLRNHTFITSRVGGIQRTAEKQNKSSRGFAPELSVKANTKQQTRMNTDHKDMN